jgi:hypothetical protein
MKVKILFLIISVVPFMLAQSAGNSGLSFLKIGAGARNVAMGDVGNSAANDVTSLFYNPARLSGKPEAELMFMHNEWIQGIRSEVLGAKAEVFGLPFAIGLNITSISDIEVRTKPGEFDSKFNANYFSGSLSTGFQLVDNLHFGATVKYLYEGVLANEATGAGFDFGIHYVTTVAGLTVSGVVKNLGSMGKLLNESTKLPADFRMGPAYSFRLSENFSAIAAAELQKYLDTDDMHILAGAEVVFNDMFALRGGYQSGYISKDFSGGLGVIWGGLRFDYAFSPFGLGLGSGHSLSLNFRF